MCINNPGHMTKISAMPINGKTLQKAGGLISMKLGMKHQWLYYYNVYINHDPMMTLTYYTVRSR